MRRGPFVVSPSNHERTCESLSQGGTMGGGDFKEMEEKKKSRSIFKKEAIFMMTIFVAITLLGLLVAFVVPLLWRFLSH